MTTEPIKSEWQARIDGRAFGYGKKLAYETIEARAKKYATAWSVDNADYGRLYHGFCMGALGH